MKVRHPLSSLVCSIEGDAPTDGGGGAPAAPADPAPVVTPDPAPAAPAAPSAEDFASKVLSILTPQVQEISRNSVHAEQRRSAKGPDKGTPKPTTPAAPEAETGTSSEVAELRAQMARRDAVEDLQDSGWTKAKAKLMVGQYLAAEPADPAQWVREMDTALGVPEPKPQPTAQETADAAATAAAPAAPMASAPAVPTGGGTLQGIDQARGSNGCVDVFNNEVAALLDDAQLRTEFEKTLAAAKSLSGAPPLPAALRNK